MGCARRAVHVGPSLWREREGANEHCVGKREGPFWNLCTRARSNLAD